MSDRYCDAYTAHRQRLQEIRHLERELKAARRRVTALIHKIGESKLLTQNADNAEAERRSEEICSELKQLCKEKRRYEREIESKIEEDLALTPADAFIQKRR